MNTDNLTNEELYEMTQMKEMDEMHFISIENNLWTRELTTQIYKKSLRFLMSLGMTRKEVCEIISCTWGGECYVYDSCRIAARTAWHMEDWTDLAVGSGIAEVRWRDLAEIVRTNPDAAHALATINLLMNLGAPAPNEADEGGNLVRYDLAPSRRNSAD